MNELIKIETRDGVETCNARELYEYMGVQSKFADWIKNRILKYCFIEHQDYVAVSKKLEYGGATKEYYISIDMAKELSMVENNDKGREARQYFILMEKRAKILTSPELSEAEIVQKALQIQQKKIKQLSIKAQVADELADSKGLFLPTMVGKMITGEPNKFCQWLVDNKIMYRKGKEKTLVPMSPYDHKDKGYFYVKMSMSKGKAHAQTFFTSRGICWIQVAYFKKNNLLNLDYNMGE